MVIYISNLHSQVGSDELKNLFTLFGEVDCAVVIKDKITNLSRGFGFVEMRKEEAVNAAVSKLNGQMFGGKAIVVKVSNPVERSYL
jgi:RNA recognition motif-containing protein